ncbi:hypothetical protein GBZ26_06075 [Azospirillum formosense]|uniref:AAA+ ATPase domain-containing protein n=1 Tax=Azospirillum formosense TaxID=861533 RepID=A0ABX2L0R4_9PROT|nr:hypothetical protein [Azospirillum formosense]MBY3754364.1 hypothetical protein [Azospirillum formosense]NUB18780.1 hypothetical protein [Azospirillum formosense]
MSPAPIVIDLVEPTDVVLISEPDKRIQRDATEHAKALLTRFVQNKMLGKESNEPKDEWVRDRVHNAILVNGSRGSGKTTFIRNIFNDIHKSKDGALGGLDVLDIIDPTLVEGKENIIITIVAQIVKKCIAHYNNRQVPPKGDDKYSQFKDALKKLAGGFSLLEGVGSERAYDASWDDPQHVMNHGLERALSGSEFEQCFHAFIRYALEFLGKSAFVLAFDDIDTKFEKGWPVLETIRKYLTTPQIILLISGDFGLYSQLLRREQYLNLGDSLLRHDRPHRDHHGDDSLMPWAADPLVRMVDRLEEQYLQKVLKPENRITLSTLAEIGGVRTGGHEIIVKTSDSSRELNITKFIDRLLEIVIFVTDSGDAALYRRAILSQPLRTVIQFLAAGDKVVAEGDDVKPESLNEFRASLPNIFASALYHKNLDPIAIGSGDPDALIAQMIAWSETTDSWETAYRLRPEYGDADQNMVAIVFASQFAKIFNEAPGQALVYMIKLGLTREFMLQRREVKSRAIVQALGLDMRERPSTVARRAIGVQRSLSRRELGLDRGTVPVSGAKIDTPNMVKHLYAGRTASGKSGEVVAFFKKHVGELDKRSREFGWRPILAWWKLAKEGWRDPGPLRGYVYNTVSSLKQKFGRAQVMHLVACIMSDARSQDRAHVSIFPLIASLAEFLEIGVENDDSERLAQVQKTFVRLCQFRSYPAPSFNIAFGTATETPVRQSKPRNTDDVDEDEAFDEEISPNIGESLAEQDLEMFLEYFDKWLKESSTMRLRMPPSIYSRIITRFYYTLTRMDEELTAGAVYTGSMLHRQIIAFLNSVLVEEMLAAGVNRKIIPKRANSPSTAEPVLDNPTTSDTSFWQNFPFKNVASADNYNGSADVDFNGLPLFKLIFSCPLWAFFLMPQTVVARGNKVQGWKILDQQLRCWFGVAPDDNEMKRRRSAVEITDGEIGPFDNLWAPLNSVPVLKSGAMQRAVWEPKPIDPSDLLPKEQRADSENALAEGAEAKETDDIPGTDDPQPRRPKREARERGRRSADEPVTAPEPGHVKPDNGQVG